MLARPVLLYDGECAFCRMWVRRIRRWDRHDTIECVPARDRFERGDLPDLSDHAVNARMHLILQDGRIFTGGAALPELLRLLPGGRVPRLLFLIPGIPWVATKAYDLVARHRHRFGCEGGSCGQGAS